VTRQAIDFILSPYRRQALALLYLRPDERFHVREIERLTGISAGSLHRELSAMAAAGLLNRRRQGNQVLYQANRHNLIFEDLASILRKTVGLGNLLREALEAVAARIDFAFVFGSMAAGTHRPDSDLDLCILGQIELIDVVKALSAVQNELRREINPVVMSKAKFREALATGDRFAERVFDEPKLFLIGAADEFGQLGENRAA
jgi:predicted nucleotidyltransferase